MEETRKPARKPRAAAATKPVAKKAAGTGKPAARKSAAKARPATPGPSPAEREEMVRKAAYFRAQRRGFAPGYEWEDWLAAEGDVRDLLGAAPAPTARKAPVRKTRSTRSG